jgi:hypothetical protein
MDGRRSVSAERRWWTLALVALGVFTFAMLLVGSIGAPRAEVDPVTIEELLEGGPPAEHHGDEELTIVGWYAELDADCAGDDGGAGEAAWLQAECPLRVLLPAQPDADVTQEELLRDGIRLAAPVPNVFPSRAEPTGANLRGQQLVYVGHFDDPASTECVPERLSLCRNTFVATDYDEQVR